jgi:hypothetical protein
MAQGILAWPGATPGTSAGATFLLAVTAMLAAALCIRRARQFSFWRCTVINTSNSDVISERGNEKRQNPAAPGLVRFRKNIEPLLRPEWGAIEKISALRHWARIQQSQDQRIWQFPPRADSGDVDPEVLLQQQRALLPGACRRFAYVFAGALLSAGIPARLVSLQAFPSDGLGHIMVEAWVEELKRWVLADPTHDTMFLVDGRYASLLELRRALLAGRFDRIQFERNGSDLEPGPRMHYFAQIAKHVFVLRNERFFTDPPLTKASVWRFRVLHFVDECADPYPALAKRMLVVGAAVFAGCSILLLAAAVFWA